MIEYVLAVQICISYEAPCHWEMKNRFPTEERCIANGLLQLPAQFKCILMEKRHGPDQRTPLPQPRPEPK